MIAEALSGAEVPEGLRALLSAVQSGAFPQAQAVKSQLTGPITLARCAPSAGSLLSLADAVAARAVAQAQAITQAGQRPVILLDEPCLGLPELPPRCAVIQALRRPILAAQAHGARVGLHCCSAMDLGLLDELPLTIYSFDADHGLETAIVHPAVPPRQRPGGRRPRGHLPPARAPAGGAKGWRFSPAVSRLLRRGGVLALGLVPTDRAPSVDDMESRLRAAIFTSGWALDTLGPQLWLTASCGLGLCSPPLAERIMEATARLGRRLVS